MVGMLLQIGHLFSYILYLSRNSNRMVTSTTRWVGGHTYYVRSKTLCLLYLEGGAKLI
jgi:hypothetical protein